MASFDFDSDDPGGLTRKADAGLLAYSLARSGILLAEIMRLAKVKSLLLTLTQVAYRFNSPSDKLRVEAQYLFGGQVGLIKVDDELLAAIEVSDALRARDCLTPEIDCVIIGLVRYMSAKERNGGSVVYLTDVYTNLLERHDQVLIDTKALVGCRSYLA